MFPKDTKILIVDDMMTMRKLVKKTLNDNGYMNVTEADDGDHAWPEIEKGLLINQPYQLVISDWNMPRMSGVELLRKMRTKEETRPVPLILLTAEAEKEQVLEAVKAGVSAYITKPFTPTGLMEKLGTVWMNKTKT
jgi:two-component system, chemotaxis family, chemotaxis protein CheY